MVLHLIHFEPDNVRPIESFEIAHCPLGRSTIIERTEDGVDYVTVPAIPLNNTVPIHFFLSELDAKEDPASNTLVAEPVGLFTVGSIENL